MEQEYLISDILTAMEHHELKVFYQPKYDTTTCRLKSAEALIRWEREDGMVVLPDRFLPAMEQTDIIIRKTGNGGNEPSPGRTSCACTAKAEKA